MKPVQVAVSDLKVGDVVPPFEKTFSAVDMFAYGAATWDWARVHYDQAYVKELGFKDVFVDGQHYGAIFAQILVDWLGPYAFVKRMKLSYRALTYRGERVVVTGTVSDISQEDRGITCTFIQQASKGAQLVADGKTVVQIASIPEVNHFVEQQSK
jgi:acyl dehydratase